MSTLYDAGTKLAEGQSIVIQVFGDSTAWGYGDDGEVLAGTPWTPPTLRGWPGRLGIVLGQYFNATVQVWTWNFGVNTAYFDIVTLYTGTGPATITIYDGGWPGGTMANLLSVMPALLPVSNPDLIIGYDGYNDLNGSAVTFASNYATFISDVQATYCPGAPIVICTQNGTPNAYDPSGYNTMIDQYLPGASTGFMSPPLQASTNTSNLWIFDTQQCPLLSTDIYAGVHPNASGYTKLANWMMPRLFPARIISGKGSLSATAASVQFSVPVPIGGHGALSAHAYVPRTGQLPYTLPAQLPYRPVPQGMGTLSAKIIPRLSCTASTSGHGSLSGVIRYQITSSISGHGSLTSQAYVLRLGQLPFHLPISLPYTAATVGTGALSATIKMSILAPAHLSGQGSLRAVVNTGQLPYSLPFKLSTLAVPKLSGNGTLTVGVSKGALPHPTGHGALSGVANLFSIGLNSRLSGRGVATATTSAIFYLSLVGPSGHGSLHASASIYAVTRSGALSGSGNLSATAYIFKIDLSPQLSGRGVLHSLTNVGSSRVTLGTGAGALVATALPVRSETFPGRGVLSANTQIYQLYRSASLNGQGIATTTTKAIFSIAPHPLGQGQLSTPAPISRPFFSYSSAGSGGLSVQTKPRMFSIPVFTGGGHLHSRTVNQLVLIGASIKGKGTLQTSIALLSSGHSTSQGSLSAQAFNQTPSPGFFPFYL